MPLPLQLGVGVRGGCEAIVLADREVLERSLGKWLLLLDLIYAFNEANRKVGIEEVAKLFPEILEWVKTCYVSSSRLLFGSTTILSEAGSHQGDPLASLFALELQPIILMIQEEVPTLETNSWFLDDGTEVGTKEELEKVVDNLER